MPLIERAGRVRAGLEQEVLLDGCIDDRLLAGQQDLVAQAERHAEALALDEVIEAFEEVDSAPFEGRIFR